MVIDRDLLCIDIELSTEVWCVCVCVEDKLQRLLALLRLEFLALHVLDNSPLVLFVIRLRLVPWLRGIALFAIVASMHAAIGVVVAAILLILVGIASFLISIGSGGIGSGGALNIERWSPCIL
jgi:hypothetical protein